MLPIFHVSFVVAGSLVGPAAVRYFTVGAATPADALKAVADQLGNPTSGEFRVMRADRGLAAMPGVMRAESIAA